MFGDLYEEKKSKINSQDPVAGSAFIMDLGSEAGHVGMVEEVMTDENGNVTSITVSDMNRQVDAE